jgi:glycosyltransferase involved in cell wall biosynthesis
LNILYVDAVGPFGGAAKSLYDICHALMLKDCKLFFLVTNGSSIHWYKNLSNNIQISWGLVRFDNTNYGFYRGLRWLLLFREFVKIPSTILNVFLVYFRWKREIDLIHCNEVTDIIPALLLKFLFRVPLVVHVRSLQRGAVNNLRTKILVLILKKYVDSVIFIDETIKRSLPQIKGEVIHNSLNINIDDNIINKFLVVRKSNEFFNVVFLGNIQLAKGFLDIIHAFSIIKSKGINNIRLNVYGTNTYSRSSLLHRLLSFFGFATDASISPECMVNNLGIGPYVKFHGFTTNLFEVFSCAHLLLFPSHFNAPGRPIFEAGFFAVPSITCISNPTADTFVPFFSGLIVESYDPEGISDAIISLYNDRSRAELLGLGARQIAKNSHSLVENSDKLFLLYFDLVN